MVLNPESLQMIAQLLDEKLDQKFSASIENLRTEFNSSFSSMEGSMSDLKHSVSDLKSTVSDLKSTVSGLKLSIAKLDARLTHVEHDVRDINLNLENHISPQIRLLAEVYVPKAEEFERSVTDMIEMRSSIDILKITVSDHSKQLQKLEIS